MWQGKTIWLFWFLIAPLWLFHIIHRIIIGKIYSVKLKSNLQTLIVVEENILEGEFKRTLTLQLGPAYVVIARL